MADYAKKCFSVEGHFFVEQRALFGLHVSFSVKYGIYGGAENGRIDFDG